MPMSRESTMRACTRRESSLAQETAWARVFLFHCNGTELELNSILMLILKARFECIDFFSADIKKGFQTRYT